MTVKILAVFEEEIYHKNWCIKQCQTIMHTKPQEVSRSSAFAAGCTGNHKSKRYTKCCHCILKILTNHDTKRLAEMK
jgi:hypothetical protein